MTRREVAGYIARQLHSGDRGAVLSQAAAWLLENRRGNESRYLANDIAAVLEADGHIAATITTAHPISEAVRNRVSQRLKDDGATTVELQTSIDTAVIGGAVITTPTRELDLSLRSALNQLLDGGTR